MMLTQDSNPERPGSGRLGASIRARRRELGLTQAQLGELVHVTERAIRAWEAGASMPSSEDAWLLEWALSWHEGAVGDIASGDGSVGVVVDRAVGVHPRSPLAKRLRPRPGREVAWDEAWVTRSRALERAEGHLGRRRKA